MTLATLAPPRDGSIRALVVRIVHLYLRVSTVEQAEEGVSLDAQEAELRRLAEQRWPDARILVHREEGKSAREGKTRPTYESLCQQLGAGHALLAVERSRLARSVTEWLTLRKLCAEHSVHLETVNGGTEDTTTATGRLIGTILAAVAEFESDLKSERVKRATSYLQTNGLWHGGRLPLTLTVSPERILTATDDTPHIGEAFRLLVEEGWSVKRIARWLGDQLGCAIPNVRRRVLRNPHYAGYLTHGRDSGKLVEGAHEAFVPRDLWHRAQAILDKQQTEGTRHPRRNPFGAVARCYCGGRLERHLQSSGKYVALRCERRRTKECDSPFVPAENFEASVVSVLAHAHADLAASLDHPKWTWYATSDDTEPERRERLAEAATELADVEARRQRLYDAYEEGTIDRDKYLERARALNDRRASLDAHRAELIRDDNAVRADLEALRDQLAGHGADLPEGPRPIVLWLTSPFEQRDELIRSTIERIDLHPAGDGTHALTVTFRAGPQLTAYVATRRSPESATWRELGFGLCVTEPRAPPRAPSFRCLPRISASRPLARVNRLSVMLLLRTAVVDRGAG